MSSVNSVEIINDLATGGATKALSAEQGKVLYFSKLASSGSNYLYVSGIGNPTENAIELQAAYDEAKKMPRFLGFLNPSNTVYIYAGQTFGRYIEGILKCYKVLVDGTYNPLQMPESLIVTEAEAKSTRTKVVVAPGEYDFGATAFVADTSGIDIVSLTGNSDVIISSTEVNFDFGIIYGIKVTADNILIKGINCKTNTFYIGDYLYNLICEYCTGGDNSFGSYGGTASGTFNYCTGGNSSFGYGGTLSGTFNYCTGGDSSFGNYGGTIESTARIYYTRLTAGTFVTPVTGGRLILCIDGGNNIITV